MSKQRPDPDKIANKLAGGSAFFRTPDRTGRSETPIDQPPPASVPAESQSTNRTPDRPGRPMLRQMIRHAFELYMDQLEALRDLAAEQRERGEMGSMSKMVREAIDRYLRDHRSPAG